MAPSLVFIALILPLTSGAAQWPWYLAVISGVIATVGLCLAKAQTVRLSRDGRDVVAVGGGLIAANSTACAVLFALGWVLSLL